MKFWADLHIHSKYSMATSKECDPENLVLWAGRKGLALIGTGDFTHPAWRQELKEKLEPAEEGFWRLKASYRRKPESGPLVPGEVRFVISGEISTIYKKGGKTRKVHHLILLPSFEEAEKLCARLAKIGNIEADGRPILGLDSRELLEMIKDSSPDAIYIPAHIWTPHFSVFGANSGFDSLEECFEDLTGEITALETGLSSDPSMNWRLSSLDGYNLVSNSDAHSPRNLAREANLFDTDELTYYHLRKSLLPSDGGFLGTVEFFPEEGKYHWDGHRSCGVRWMPRQTKEAGRICPVCGRKVTVGVLHRVDDLADREEGDKPASAKPFERLVPLLRVIAAAEGVGENTKKVEGIYFKLLERCGAELTVLRETPLEEVAGVAGTLTAEGIRRVRQGILEIIPGFDGEYGKVMIFTEDERRAYLGQAALFAVEEVPEERVLPSLFSREERPGDAGLLPQEESAKDEALNPEQLAAVTAEEREILVLAGPGTGKTRTLLYRVEYLLKKGINPEEITCVTFTKKAAEEMRRRLDHLVSPAAGRRVQVGTFHRICLNLLDSVPGWKRRPLLSEYELSGFLPEVKGVSARDTALVISRLKNGNLLPEDPGVPEEWREPYRLYQERLADYEVMDFDEVLLITARLLEEEKIPGRLLRRFHHLLVDEFQDLTPLQYRLVGLLAAAGKSLFAIGDPDQAIYGFRGSDPGVFRQFAADYPGHREINLKINYRSVPHILRAAGGVIRHNPQSKPVVIEPFLREKPGRIRFITAAGEKAEGIAVAREILRLVGGTDMLSAHGDFKGGKQMGGYSFGEIAVLYRAGRQVEALEEALTREGFPYKVVGEKKLLYNKKVRETITFLHALLEPEDFLLLSAMRLSCFNPGEEVLRRLWESRRENSRSFLETAEDYADSGEATGDARKKIKDFLLAMAKYSSLRKEGVLPLLREWVCERGWDREEEAEELLGLAALSSDLKDFYERLLVGREADLERLGKKGPSPEYISLMTLHAAKGLEFPAVLITGVEEGLLPILNEEGEGDIPEERRLFYVGLTRAQRELILFSAARRRQYGAFSVQTVSRFVREIPQEFIAFEEQRKKSKKRHSQEGLF